MTVAKASQREEALLLRQKGYSAGEIAQLLNRSVSTVIDWIRDIQLSPEQQEILKQRKIDAAVKVTKKVESQAEARRLRHEGMSVKQIAKTLNVAQSSVSTWVRDIVLNDEQRAELKRKQYTFSPGQHKGSQANMLKHREIRLQYQQEGRAKAREGNALHLAGCMLYWGEGAKSRNYLRFVNSDPDMMVIFIKFLRESLYIADEKIRITINCYTDNGITVEEIELFWLVLLSLPRECLGETISNVKPKSSKQKGRKLYYGVCGISVTSTELVQHVFGAIQEYTGIDKPEWLR
jgi:transposase